MKKRNLIGIISLALVIVLGLSVWAVAGQIGKIKVDYKDRKVNSSNELGAETPEKCLEYAAKAIEEGNTEEALKMFYENSHNKIKDSLESLNLEQRREYAQGLKNAYLVQDGENSKTYETEVLRRGLSPTTVDFYMIKLGNGNWIILDL